MRQAATRSPPSGRSRSSPAPWLPRAAADLARLCLRYRDFYLRIARNIHRVTQHLASYPPSAQTHRRTEWSRLRSDHGRPGSATDAAFEIAATKTAKSLFFLDIHIQGRFVRRRRSTAAPHAPLCPPRFLDGQTEGRCIHDGRRTRLAPEAGAKAAAPEPAPCSRLCGPPTTAPMSRRCDSDLNRIAFSIGRRVR